jgi:hypothetical protein
LRSDDLLFQLDHFEVGPPPPQLIAAEALGLTEPNAAGRCYPHGTMSAYTAGRCRCDSCRLVTRATVLDAAQQVLTRRETSVSDTRTVTCRGTGSGTTSGIPRVRQHGSSRGLACMICGTRTHHGFSQAEPIFRLCGNDLVTRASQRQASTFTHCPMRMRRPSRTQPNPRHSIRSTHRLTEPLVEPPLVR